MKIRGLIEAVGLTPTQADALRRLRRQPYCHVCGVRRDVARRLEAKGLVSYVLGTNGSYPLTAKGLAILRALEGDA